MEAYPELDNKAHFLLGLALVLVFFVITVTGNLNAFAQLFPESSTLDTLRDLLDGNTTLTPPANVTKSQLAQTIDQIVSADPSCNLFINTCVNIIYESPTKIVLTGDFITTIDRTYNTPIWKIVDMLETKGYTTESIELTGQGSKGNPHDYLIVMSGS